jgi:CysZ protein
VKLLASPALTRDGEQNKASRRPQRPGFVSGFRAVPEGLAFIARTPGVWPYALLPSLVASALIAGFGWLSFSWLGPAVATRFAEPNVWYAAIVHYVVAIGAALLGVFLALAITPPLSGPALERIVIAEERELGIPERAPLGFFAEITCGLRAQALAGAFSVPVLTVLWLVDLVLPVAAVVTLPCKLATVALALSWNLFDYPLTLRGVRMRQRLRLVRSNKAAVLGFGLAFSILFLVPCCMIVTLPIGVAAATRTLWALLEHDPQKLAALNSDRG